MCYSRIPGFSGWGLQRTSYPSPGHVIEQDNWLINAFQTLEFEFYKMQGEHQEENTRAKNLESAHRQVQAENKRR